MVLKKNIKFLFCCIVWIWDIIKKFCKTMVFFKNNWDIWNPKFQQNSTVYYFFFIFLEVFAFCFLFHLSKLVQKLWNFLQCFIGRVWYFTNDLWKIAKSSFQKNIYMWNNIFFQNSALYKLFFLFFYYFWHFIFNFVYLYSSKNSTNFYVFFILWIRDFIIQFWKIMEYFSKRYWDLK